MLKRFAGFGGAPVLSSLAFFLILPIISRVAGAEGWGGFATGQAVGVLATAAVRFGWGTTGPVRIAQTADARERALILEESIGARLLALALVAPIAVALTAWVVAPSARWDSAAVAFATLLVGLSPGWYCIGEGRPRGLLTYDVLPRLVATAVSAVAIVVSGDIFWYPVLLSAATIAGVVAHRATVVATPRQVAFTWGSSVRSLRRSASVAGVDTAAIAYSSSALPIASAGLAAPAVSAFASADRMYRFGLMFVEAVGNAFQAWVLEPGGPRLRRHATAVITHAVLGLVGLFGLTALGPWASGLVFGSELAAERSTCVMLGIAYFSVSTATPLIRNILVPHRRIGYIFGSTIGAAVVGVAIMVTSSAQGSALGVAAGLAASEVVILVLLAVPSARLVRVSPPHHPVTSGGADAPIL